jgi:hypothetical protein
MIGRRQSPFYVLSSDFIDAPPQAFEFFPKLPELTL